MKKRYFAPISRVIDLCGEDALLANSLTDKEDGIEYGGNGSGMGAETKGNSGWDAWDED